MTDRERYESTLRHNLQKQASDERKKQATELLLDNTDHLQLGDVLLAVATWEFDTEAGGKPGRKPKSAIPWEKRRENRFRIICNENELLELAEDENLMRLFVADPRGRYTDVGWPPHRDRAKGKSKSSLTGLKPSSKPPVEEEFYVDGEDEMDEYADIPGSPYIRGIFSSLEDPHLDMPALEEALADVLREREEKGFSLERYPLNSTDGEEIIKRYNDNRCALAFLASSGNSLI